ncbi:MAG: hypothetical protein KDI61_13515 [Alphaproteobacteria bacterium]|nr:hypothetical protein [Alphaproteobacteria bacterium]
MDPRLRYKVPVIASEAFNDATAEMIFNEVTNWIKYDPQANEALSLALREMGQRRFISMTSGIMDSRVSLVLYAGNGHVVKIIPSSYSPKDYVFQMPPISERKVQTDQRDYLICTYPWLAEHKESTRADVEMLRKETGILGQEFIPGDDTPRNIRRLPDAEQTLVSIDADTFTTSRDGLNYGPELLAAWHEYLAELFPVYKLGALPPQTSDTSFDFVMNYNREARLSRFDPLAPSPIVHMTADGAPTSKKHSFWEIFTKLHHD